MGWLLWVVFGYGIFLVIVAVALVIGSPRAEREQHEGCTCAGDHGYGHETGCSETVHFIQDGDAVTRCCGRTPFELPRSDRLIVSPEQLPLYRSCAHPEQNVYDWKVDGL